jgi:hypothetical protein
LKAKAYSSASLYPKAFNSSGVNKPSIFVIKSAVLKKISSELNPSK